jgi:hypothetical protein
MPTEKDSVVEKRNKLLRLENSVSELIKQQKDKIAPGEDLDV